MAKRTRPGCSPQRWSDWQKAGDWLGPHILEEREEAFLWEFHARAHGQILDAPDKDAKLEWLSLLQHYGGPTRLLDVTRSPYVAAYFAADKAGAGDCAVWAFDGAVIDEASVPKEAYQPREQLLLEAKQRLAESCLSPVDGERDLGVVHVVPKRFNDRLEAQQGSFLLPFVLTREVKRPTSVGHASSRRIVDFVSNLSSTLGASSDGIRNQKEEQTNQPSPTATLIKFIIGTADPHVRHQLWQDLSRMNVTAASLFPGLSGIAQSFRHRVLERK